MRLARELGLPIRGNPWSEGDGLDLALERGGGRRPATLEEFYGRAMPAGIPIDEAEFVPLSQLYGQFAEVVSEDGVQRFEGEVAVVGDEPRPDDRALAGGPRLVPRAREPTSASASASGRSPT